MTTNAANGPTAFPLLRAAEAVTSWRPLAMAAMAAIGFFLFIALTGWIAQGSMLLGLVFGLLSLVFGLVCYSSVGIVLMRRTQGIEIGFVDAFMQALLTVHRLLGIAGLLFLAYIGVALAAAVVLLICKLPGVGPLMYAVVMPVLTVLVGIIIAAMFYVVMPLAAPAIWAGNTVWQTAARLLMIVRQRLLPVITNLVILSILVMFLWGVVGFILFSGYFAVLGLSSMVGIQAGGGLMGMMSHGAMGGMGGLGGMDAMGGMSGLGLGGNSYTAAFAFASALLVTIAMVVPFLTFINGTCLVYLQMVDGLDVDAAEEHLRTHMEEAKRRAQQAQERAAAQMQQVKAGVGNAQPSAAAPAADPLQTPAPTQPPQGPAPASAYTPVPTPEPTPAPVQPAPPAPPVVLSKPVPAARVCVGCQRVLAADELFCGECGAKNPL